MNILLYALKSERASRAAEYLATLFPNAIYHVVAVAHTPKSRVTYTTMLGEVMRRIAEDAVASVELALLGRKVITVKKVVLSGKPEDELAKYASEKRVDLIAIAPSLDGRLHTPRLVQRLVERSMKPVFIYTQNAKSPPKQVSRVVVASYTSEGFTKCFDILKHIVDEYNPRLVACELSEGLEPPKNFKERVKCVGENAKEKLLQISNDADLVVLVAETSKDMKRKRFRLGRLEEELIHCSKAPVILLA